MRSHALDAITTGDGTLAVLAMDQRGTLRRMLAEVDRAETPDEEIVSFKADLLSGLAGSASAFLVDPTFGVPAKRVSGDISSGLLIAAEPAVRGKHEGEPIVARDPDQDAEWVREQGGDALKFLVQVRADRVAGADGRDLTAEAVEATRAVIDDCSRTGVPSVIENLIYPLNGESALDSDGRATAIIEAAAMLDDLGPSLLKLEYPGSPSACRELGRRLTVPWAVLSAGVDSRKFGEVLRISCDEGGACGFIAGRSVWRETVAMNHGDRVRFLADIGRRRLDEYREIISGRARPIHESAGGTTASDRSSGADPRPVNTLSKEERP